jgi:GH35 family endo-1,4-beta-xylanase
MKAKSVYSAIILFLLAVPFCFTQNNITAEITPAAIDASISEIRMGDIIVKTSPGANIEIQQVRHEFLFGTAITNKLAEMNENAMSEQDRERFLKVLAENFNYAVHEDALKWYACEKEYNVIDYTEADRIWELCHALDIPMRGHCIFWAKDKYIMPWLRKFDNDELRGAVTRRAIDVTKHFKGRIDEFDLNYEIIHGDF